MKKVVIPYEVSRYIMIGFAVIAFSGSIVAAVVGLCAWKGQSMENEVLGVTKQIREKNLELGLGTHEVVGIYWNEYANEELGYSFLYPSTWHLSGMEETNMLDVSSAENPEDGGLSGVRFSVSELSDPGQPIDEVMTDSGIEVNKYNQYDFPVGGRVGVLLSKKEMEETFGGMVFVICGRRSYQISWDSSTPGAASVNELTMRGIAESLIFIDGCGD